MEGELADEELRRLLVPTNLTESDGTRPEAMRLLDTTSGGLRGLSAQVEVCEDKFTHGSLARLRLGSELLAGRLATGRLAGGLLSAGHW